MLCKQCEEGDHDNCGMQTWCTCECEGRDGYNEAYYVPTGYYVTEDLDGERLVKKDSECLPQ